VSFNTATPLSLGALRGKVVVPHAFQMLYPGCVQFGLPRAKRVADIFDPEEVAVIGLHTVFEHHEAMPSMALDACIHEYRLGLPIGVDEPGDGPVPVTMRAYGLRGTPSLVLIDRLGRRRRHSFRAEPDLLAGGGNRAPARGETSQKSSAVAEWDLGNTHRLRGVWLTSQSHRAEKIQGTGLCQGGHHR
jgi:hypothetical protein